MSVPPMLVALLWLPPPADWPLPRPPPIHTQVPLGSVTPLAACQPSAAGVALLLDQKLKEQSRIFVHPLVNTATCVLSPAGLEAYLR